MNEVDFILGETFFETRAVDVRRKSVWFVVCRDGKEVTLNLTKTPTVEKGKLNLVPIDQMTNKQIMVVQMKQLQEIQMEARNDGPPQSTSARCWGVIANKRNKSQDQSDTKVRSIIQCTLSIEPKEIAKNKEASQ